MKRSFTYYVYLISLLLGFSAYSQDLKFVHLNPDNGLSTNSVNCITQDKKGFLWFGTENGLNKFDGKKITVYKNNPQDTSSISDNWIYTVFSDNEDDLWIGTDGEGLNFFDFNSNKFKSYRYVENCKNCISNNIIKSIIQDKDGLLWIGTDLGLNTYDKKTGKFENFISDPANPHSIPNHQINTLYLDKKGIIWIGTYNSGLISYDKKNRKFTPHYNSSSFIEDKNNKNFGRIKAIYEDSKNNLWVGTDGGLCIFDRISKKFKFFGEEENAPEYLKKPRVFSIKEGAEGNIWISTYGEGLIIYNPQKKSFRNYRNLTTNPSSIASDHLRAVYEDEAGSIWIATGTSGISVYHRTKNQFGLFKIELDNPNALHFPPMCFLDDKNGALWIGTFGGGISQYDREKGNFKHFDKSGNKIYDNILALYEDANSNIWIGSWGNGFNYFDRKSNSFKPPFTTDNSDLINNNVTVFCENNKNQIWVGTLKGLNLFDIPTKKIIKKYTTEEGLSANGIYYLLKDNNDVLWIGTNGGGLNSLHLKTGKIKHYKKGESQTSISNDKVNCIYDDKKGNLWLGTRGGLNKFNKETGQFTRFYESDGLSSDNVYGILGDDNGLLWMSTIKGLSRFDPNLPKDDENRFRNYFALDGLQNNEFNQFAFHRGRSGEFYFGGLEGYNTFFTGDIKDNLHIPHIVISSFFKFRKSVTLDSTITSKKFLELSYKDNFIEFEFEALDFVVPSKNLYSFKMEGFDESWSTPGNRNYASYTNLSGGDYIFRVKGSNNDGVWNENGVSLAIRINPPFYKTEWFITICILTGLLSIFLFIKYRTSLVEKEKKILEEKVQERTIELAEKNKDITSSIQYAQRIQNAILPQKEVIFKHFPNAFILYKPKDIVSGDFYWFTEIKGKKIIAAVDCTGHGVPGAFMSMIGHNLFNQVVIEKGITMADEILDEVNKGVKKSLKQDREISGTSDGMDVALCVIDDANGMVDFAGAYRPMYIMNNGNLRIIEPNKFPIGGSQIKQEVKFTKQSFKIEAGDTLYLFSDGYADQFGGENGKKFMIRRFQETLKEIHSKTMPEQEKILEKIIGDWMGIEAQVDDILVIGLRF